MPQNPIDTLRAVRARHRDARAPQRPSRDRAVARRRPACVTYLARLINHWWTRLLQAVYQGSLSEQEEQYESHSASRDYLWNTIGTSAAGVSFPILTVIATQLAGVEQAGMFSMAFVTGSLLMVAANYGVRTFQVSDIDEVNAFSSYQITRYITAALALTAGILYCTLRGYGATMTTICMGVIVYKLADGLADVYEGRLQQADKLYLAGISQTIRSVGAIVGFTLPLVIMRNLAISSVVMAVVAMASLIVVTLPLALLETEKSRHARVNEVTGLLRQCFPIFAALFLFDLTESIPKFVMEGALAYENQLYFNAFYFPAQGILIAVGFIYKPQLLRLASIWASPRKRRRFDLIIAAMLGVICIITLAVGFFMNWLGIPLMGFLYGIDFEQFRTLAILMVVAGGITAAIDFLYAIITVLRRQDAVIKLYLISFVAALALSLALVNLIGLAGAVISYLSTMGLLLVLLIVEYVRIRHRITRERNPFA